MGKKYVIELEDVSFVNDLPFPDERLYRVMGFKSLVFDKNGLEKLTPLNTEKELAKAKQEGAEEAWELARWAFSEASDSDLADAFPYEWDNGGYNRIMKLSFADAKAKYDAWIASDNCIKVGDEVKVDNICGVVTRVSDGYIALISDEGFTYIRPKEEATLTGRHFPEVTELLKRMGGNGADQG